LPKAPLTVPKAPKFQTDQRLSLKEKPAMPSSEEIELEEINRMRATVESQIKANQNTVKVIDNYSKPMLPKKEITTFKEFKLSTVERSSRHSEFRKQNMAKVDEQKEMLKQKEEQKKKEEQQKKEEELKYYNYRTGLLKSEERSESESQKQAFVSLKSKLEGVLVRPEKVQSQRVNSPVSKSRTRQLTTPLSPQLSVKKRCEFVERTKDLKSTEELEIERMEQNSFKARPLPRKILSAYKPVIGNTPSGKKTEFREFNLSQVKRKQILTTEEIELQNHCKDFKAIELDYKMFEDDFETVLGRSCQKQSKGTVPAEFKFKTDERKRDRKAHDKSEEESSHSLQRKASVVKKYKEFTIKKDENYKPTCPKAPALSTETRKRKHREDEPVYKFKAAPMPEFSKLAAMAESKINVPKMPLTKPVEFNFSTECRLRKTKMVSEALHEELNKGTKDFKATKAPKFNKTLQIKPSGRQPTKGFYPMLQSEQRMQLRKEREQKLREEMEAKEVSIQDGTEFDVTVKSSPEVRLAGDRSFQVIDINDQETIPYYE
jgi:hypothetical protein